MGLVVLIVVGALLGWLATIIFRIEEGRAIGVAVAVAALTSAVAGLIAARGAFLGGVSATALLWAALAAIVAVTVLHLVRRRAVI